MFQMSSYLTGEARAALASKLGLTDTQVKKSDLFLGKFIIDGATEFFLAISKMIFAKQLSVFIKI